MNKGILYTILLFGAFYSSLASAQKIKIDTTGMLQAKTDTTYHSPKKATYMSMALPGLGQIYNKKYWKVPVIYAGLGTTAYFIIRNRDKYRYYKTVYVNKTDDDRFTIDSDPNKSPESVLSLKDSYRHDFELSCILFGLTYLLNIVDATVDGYLYNFSVTDDLSLHVEPTITNFGTIHRPQPGFKLSMRF